tara:strand:+ start:117 stop:1088 length:972 start_codon:yes stop_codon:yes gene_type:complete
MTSRRLLFVCYPDTNHPIGGVKQIYRQVELLHRAGWDAYVLQEQPGFRADWFSSDAPVLDLESYLASPPCAENDLVVLPETWLTNVPHYLPGIPKVIFNQNAFYSFGLSGDCDNRTLDLYRHSDIKAVVTVSRDSRNLLVEGCGIPEEHCFAVINGIDRQLFHAPAVKHRRVVFLGRKHVDHARKVALMASQHPKLKNVSFRELPRLQHEEVASALQDALIFLNCGHPEGFGLPLAEAIACGCLVVGYHGLAGRDFALPHMQVVEFGDLLGLLKSVEHELDRFDAAPEAVIQERLSASENILQTYSLEAELDCCLRTWARICP